MFEATPQHTNDDFISGAWYEREYQKGWYGDNYINKDHPKWAVEFDRYYIDLIAVHTGLPNDIKILDIGCGVGNFINGWNNRGYPNTYGIDISETACKMSGNPNIQQASITDLPFEDKEFDLVFSSSFWEHIDESILAKALSEAHRVGKMQAHLIGLEYGEDPSHVNIKTMDEWIDLFWKLSPDNDHAVFEAADILLDVCPLLIMAHVNDLTEPIKRKLYSVRNNPK